MFRPDRFSFARFCLHVCLNLKPCARTKEQFSIQPCASCAQCAPESPPQGHGLVPCMFQLHVQRPRGVDFMFRLVRAESAGVRGDGLMYRLNERASCARSFSKSYKPDSSAERNPDPAGPSLCKNKGDRIFIAVSKRITGLGPATSTLARLRSTK